METNVLRVFTGHYVLESDIDSEDKLDLLKFVKVAERDELLAFLGTGEPVEVTTEHENLITETELYVIDLLSEGFGDTLKKASGYTKYASGKSLSKGRDLYGSKTRGLKKMKAGKKHMAVAAAGTAAVAAGTIAAGKLLKRRKCKNLAKGNQAAYDKCMA